MRYADMITIPYTHQHEKDKMEKDRIERGASAGKKHVDTGILKEKGVFSDDSTI